MVLYLNSWQASCYVPVAVYVGTDKDRGATGDPAKTGATGAPVKTGATGGATVPVTTSKSCSIVFGLWEQKGGELEMRNEK